MDLIVAHEERQEKVQVSRSEGGWQVLVGETAYHVDAVRVSDGVHSLVVGDCQFEVTVRREADGRYRLSTCNGHGGNGVVEVTDPLTFLAQESRGGKRGGGSQEVTAYMPGRVVAVLVKEGDTVEEGQGVVVLEAMKMENEILAERSGVISRILVEPGQNVEGGDPLFVIG